MLYTFKCRSFQERHVIAWALTHKCTEELRSVINCMHKSNFWLYACFYYLTACVWSRHVPILMLFHTNSHYLLEVTLISILILKAIDWFYKEIKMVFFSGQFTSIKRVYLYIGHPNEEDWQHLSNFFQSKPV